MSSSEGTVLVVEHHKKKRPSDAQKERIINYLELNLDVARNQFTSNDGRKNLKEKWDEISTILNGMGGAHKSPEQWKKFWTDWKLAVKKKYAAEKRRLAQSGVNGDVIERLDEIEQKVVYIMAREAIEGDGSTEHGLQPLSCPTSPEDGSSSRESPLSLSFQPPQTTASASTASESHDQEVVPELHVITPPSRRQGKRSREEEETEMLKTLLEIKKKKIQILSQENERKNREDEYKREEHLLKMELMRAQFRKLNGD